jgi:hypothetical protein
LKQSGSGGANARNLRNRAETAAEPAAMECSHHASTWLKTIHGRPGGDDCPGAVRDQNNAGGRAPDILILELVRKVIS